MNGKERTGEPLCSCQWALDCHKGLKCPSRQHHASELPPDCYQNRNPIIHEELNLHNS
jgi:hypothetical protein